jgi:hypothetical protein
MNKTKKQELIDSLDNIYSLVGVFEDNNHMSNAGNRVLQAIRQEIYNIFDELKLR